MDPKGIILSLKSQSQETVFHSILEMTHVYRWRTDWWLPEIRGQWAGGMEVIVATTHGMRDLVMGLFSILILVHTQFYM
jgi:hypothetical protein